ARHDGGPQRLTLTSPSAGLDPDAPVDALRLARTIEALGLAVAHLPPKTLVLVDDGSPDLADLEADIHVRALSPGRTALGLGTDDGPRWIAECDAAEAADAVAAILHAFARTGQRRMRDLSRDALSGIVASLPRTPFPPPQRGEGDATRVPRRLSPSRPPSDAAPRTPSTA
ncbi:precorrin-3B synthase, partial [Methylobacterium trifolii]